MSRRQSLVVRAVLPGGVEERFWMAPLSVNVRRLITHLVRVGCACVAGVLWVTSPAFAQSDNWEVDVAPLYFWASELDGRIITSNDSVSLFLPFDEAVDTLAGSFSFHGEARKGRAGFFGDIYFIRLSTDAEFVTPLSTTVLGTTELDMTVFEGGASYLVKPDANLSVIGGVRTYTQSPRITLSGPVLGVREVDVSRTATSVFAGFTYRPKLSEKWALISRADIGVGEAFEWSGTLGFAYRFKPWGGLAFGYRALGVDTGDAEGIATLPAGQASDDDRVKYDVTHYGPFLSLTLHWAQK
jgi:hypothetical protein